MRKRKRNKWMDDVSRETCERLAQVGLGSHYIAERVFGIPAGEMSYTSRLCRSAILSALHKSGIRITDWSKGVSPHARVLGEQAVKSKPRRRSA